ncbi:FAD-binding oxidoreductase [Streptomyces sp. 8L]|uniref:FAD-binding oxidoreductase n=1 Tax=Streptomyces sp. 8L TaxID=2877242 RepID=UPI001CD79D40|nr:FAD-binding oxidoreductase [Streptomyces sp. 8L]MCA1218666.1 FAD-binding oxidoreductase [Streptomyces sp. 8L]
MADLSSALSALSRALSPDAVRTDDESLDRSSHDSWPLSSKLDRLGRHGHRADAVVAVADEAEIRTVLAVAAAHDVPVTVRGLASSVTGQPLPVRGGIVLDLSGLPDAFEVDTEDLTVRASAGYNGGALEDELNARGLTLGHSPQSLYRSSVGGWLATLATGQFSSYYGGIEDLVTGFTVILATGETLRLKASPRAAMGPDLRQLFLGSEGTLGVITSVTLKVFPLPAARLLQTYALPSVEAGVAILRAQAAAGLRPFLLRLYDPAEARHALQDGSLTAPVLFTGTQGTENMAHAEAAELDALVTAHGGRALGPEGAEKWMARRFDFSSVENLLAQEGGYAETIEVAHTWRGIMPLYEALTRELAPLADEVLAHFSHVYTQGTSLYLILRGTAADDAEAVERLERIWATAMRVALDLGAELSHHHGGGLARSPYTRRSLGASHLLLRRLKNALDPNGVLNPGKLGL